MKSYNGFSAQERSASIPPQKEAEIHGKLIRPKTCDVCTARDTWLAWHLEDYNDPLKDARALCPECHMRLHARFSKPGNWLKYCLELREGRTGAYTTVGQYMAATRSEWTAPDATWPILFIPTVGKWWEHLALDRSVNVKDGAAEYLKEVSQGKVNHVEGL